MLQYLRMNALSPSKREKLIILALLLAGLAGVLTYVRLYDSAFPSASLNLKITRSDAQRIGEKFLKSRGFDVSKYESATTFGYDSEGKEFLERNLGLRAANKLMAGRVKTWYWRVRWFKPLQEEEFSARISLTGDVIGLSHKIPENAKGKNLPHAKAARIARDFLASVGVDPGKYKPSSDSSEKRPNRTDHSFEWKERGFEEKGASNRIFVSIAGDSVRSFGYFLKVPETWERKVSSESGKGDLLMTIAGALSAILGVALLVSFLIAVTTRIIRWRFTIILAGALVAVQVAGSLNSLPMMKSWYSTTESMGSFWGGQIIGIIAGAVGIAVSMFVLGSAGDAMHRIALPGRPHISALLTRRGISSRQFARSSLAGFGLGLAQLGYVSAFYVIAMKYFKVWSPAEVPYDNTLSTALPWIYPLTIGLSAALNEELFFRLFSVSFLKRYLKLTWLAVIAPAVIWAFLHSNYPQQPAYVRGIEISIYGVILGLVFLRYGIIATIVSHYTYNAVVAGTLLVKSDNLYFRSSGFAVMGLMLLPLIPAAISIFRKTPELEELPPQETPVQPAPTPKPPPAEAPPTHAFEPHSAGKLKSIALISALVTIAGFAAFYRDFLPLEKPLKIVNRKAAHVMAEQSLRKMGVNPRGYMTYTQYGGDSTDLEATYVVRHLGQEAGTELLEKELGDAGWYATWFKPLKKESYDIWLDPKGRFTSWDHTVEEDAFGANLSQTNARHLAESWLKAHSTDLSQYKPVDSSSDTVKHRTDHWFTWEKKKLHVAQAKFRLSVEVQGNEVLALSRFVKIPDEYERNEYKRTTRMTIISGILGLVSMGLGVAVLIVFVMQFAAKRIDLKLGLKWGLLFAAFSALGWVNDLPTFFSGYTDTDPLSRYILTDAVRTLVWLVGAGIGGALLVVFANAIYRQAFPDKPAISEWFGRRGGQWRIRAFQEGAVVAYGTLLVSMVITATLSHLDDRFFRSILDAQGGWHSGLTDGFSPILGAVSSLPDAFYVVFGIGIGVSLIKIYVKKTWIFVPAAIAFILLSTGADAKNWLEFGQHVTQAVVGVPLAYLLLTRWFGHNAYSYIIMMVAGSLISAGASLLGTTDLSYQINGLILVLLGLTPLFAALYFRYAGKTIPAAETTNIFTSEV